MKFVLMLCALPASLPLPAQYFNPETEGRAYPPHKLVGNIYYAGTNDVTSFLITTPAGHILIDAGFESTVPIIEAAVTRLGFKITDVKIILNSHAHIDHAGGMAALKKLTGAQVFASELDAPAIESGGDTDFRWSKEYRWPKCPVDRKLKDFDKVQLGGLTLVARLTPGHTPGATTWTTTAKEGNKSYNVVFLSSAVIDPDVSLTPDIGGFTRPGIADDYKAAFKTWRSLPCDVFLASHAGFFSMQRKYETPKGTSSVNHHIDNETYPLHLDIMERRYRDQLAREATMPKVAPPPSKPDTKKKKAAKQG